MGSRGSSSRSGGSGYASPVSFTQFTQTNNANINAVFQQLQQQMNDPTPSAPPVNTNGVDTLSQMSDDELAALVAASKTVDMPNHIGDVNDATQRFVYAAGLNEKPQAMDAAQMAQYMKDNNIPQGQMLSRSVNANTITVNGTQIVLSSAMIKAQFTDGKYNYIGGKYGGMAYGAGTYFAMNGGGNTGYGGDTLNAILSPSARVVYENTLYTKARSFAASHPKFAKAVGSINNRNQSIYALAMGYNVISSSPNIRGNSGDYYNVIDRKALIVRK